MILHKSRYKTLIITNLIIFYQNYINVSSIPKPYPFVTTTLHCGPDLSEIIVEVNRLLPQLSDFITQFNNIIIETGVNVVTDSAGNMSIDVPHDMSDSVANRISTRVGIVDRLITTQGTSINDLFQQGLKIEQGLKANNPNYTSQLTDQIAQFKQLNASYKH